MLSGLMKTVDKSCLGPIKAVPDCLVHLVGFQEGSEKGKLNFGGIQLDDKGIGA